MTDFDSKPVAFQTEQLARLHAAAHFANVNLSIIHSPHATNRAGDYFIDAPGTLIRTRWEKLLFEGAGKDAAK